jgi:predicted deacylase
MPGLPAVVARAALGLVSVACLAACTSVESRAVYGEGRPSVRDLSAVEQRLQEADRLSPSLALTDIGREGVHLPVWRMAFRAFQPLRRRMLLLAGARGTDLAGPTSALDLIDELSRMADPAACAYDMDIIPIVNPWGWARDLRFGRAGTDVTSDFTSFKDPASRIIRDFLRQKSYDLAVELRENPEAAGFSVWQYGADDPAAARRVAAELQSAGFAMETRSGDALIEPRKGIVQVSSWELDLMAWRRSLSMAGFIRRNNARAVFTIEAPQALPLATRAAALLTATKALIALEDGAGPN